MAATTLTDRAVIRLWGEDVRGFVQGLVTSDVSGDLPVWAGLLTPQGKCLFDFLIWSDSDDLLLDCEAAAVDDLVKRLTIYWLCCVFCRVVFCVLVFCFLLLCFCLC